MSYRPSAYHPAVIVLIVSFSTCILASLVWLVVMGDGHEAPERVPWGYDVVHVCPSAAWSLEPLQEARVGYLAACVPMPEVVDDDCDGPPAAGVAQVRHHGDQVWGWTAAVDGAFVDRIAHRYGSDVPDTAVAYLLEQHSVRECTPAHVLGHLGGYRVHATAATSVMADPCGVSFEHVGECGEGPGG